MSRKELEDKYLTLLEQHLQLKSDLNSSEERLKLVSTKLQRVSNQHKSENSCICKYSGKVTHTLQDVIAKQKYKIEDLEMKNLGLLERIRILKMNLSTQRQFLGTTGSMKRFHSASILGSLDTGRKPQSHRNVPSIKRMEKMVSPSTSSKSSSMKELLEIAVVSNETVNIIHSGKVSKEIQTNDEECRAQVNITKELHCKILQLEKELQNVETKYNKQLLSLKEERKSLVIDRDVALSSAKQSSRQQLEQVYCWNKVTAEQLHEILHRNSELIIQLSMERKKVSDLELKLKECLYTTQLVDLVYDRLKHDEYICSVCKSSEHVVERNCPESTEHTDFTRSPIENKIQHITETDIHINNPNTAEEQLNTIMNGRVAADDKDSMVVHSVGELLLSEVPDRDHEVMENHSWGSRTPPLPLTATPERDKTLLSSVREEDIPGLRKNCISSDTNDNNEGIITFSKESSIRQRTPLIIKVPSTSVHSEDDDDVVTETRRDSEDTKDIAKIDTFDNVPETTHLEQSRDASKTKKNKDEVSPRSSKMSQRTLSISHETYTIQKHENNGYYIHESNGTINPTDQNEPRNSPSEVSDDTEVGSPWLQEDEQCQYKTGRQCSSISDSSYSDVTLSEGERFSITSIDDSSHIPSSGWSQQFKSTNRSPNTQPGIETDEVCVFDRAKRVLSAVSEVLTECRDLENKARLMSADC